MRAALGSGRAQSSLPARANALEVIAPLSRSAQSALERAERTNAQGLESFIAVGLALARIRDGRLYRAGKIERLVVNKLDRLGRSLTNLAQFPR